VSHLELENLGPKQIPTIRGSERHSFAYTKKVNATPMIVHLVRIRYRKLVF